MSEDESQTIFYDSLGSCEICGEDTDDRAPLCKNCEEQERIDNSNLVPPKII